MQFFQRSEKRLLTAQEVPPIRSLLGGATHRAQMAELVDALASGASDLTVVEVRVLFWAPYSQTASYPTDTAPSVISAPCFIIDNGEG